MANGDQPYNYSWRLVRRDKEKYMNVLFTECPQDKFMLVVRGGRLVKVIHEVPGWKVNDNFEFEELPAGERIIPYPWQGWFGLHFVGGIPFFNFQRIHNHEFSWNRYGQRQGQADAGFINHDKETIFIEYFEFQYAMRFKDLEVGGDTSTQVSGTDKREGALIPITFEITLRTRMLRPRVAIMLNHDWLGGVLQPKIQQILLEFAGARGYEEIIRGSQTSDGVRDISRGFSEFVLNNKDFEKEVLDQVGVKLIDVGIIDVIPDEEYNQAILAVAKAEKAKEQQTIEAQGYQAAEMIKAATDRDATVMRAEGDAARIKMTIVDPIGGPGPQVGEVLEAERLAGKNPSISTLVLSRGKKPPAMVAIPPTPSGKGPKE